MATVTVNDRHLYERELLAARRKAEEALEQLKVSEQALRATQAQEAKRARFAEQMVGIVSHDLRNPLSAVLMSAHVLGMSDLSTHQMRAVARIVTAASQPGTAGFAARGSGIGSEQCFMATATKPSPRKGSCPVRHS